MSEVMKHRSDRSLAVTLSEVAMRHILSFLTQQKANKGVRFSVKKTGCSGLSYAVDFVTIPKNNDIVQVLNDEYQLYIDKASYPYLKGMHVDYIKQGLNYKFVFNNPNQTGECGCGESFTVNE